MQDAIKEIEKLQDEIGDTPEEFGTDSDVEAAYQILEILKIRLETL